MTRTEFRDLLDKATREVIECTREYVWNPIPDDFEYRVFANKSFDRHPDGRVLTDFPEDSLRPGECRRYRDPDDVVGFLWRQGRVPQWINVQIEEATDTLTSIDLVCCGRYTDDEECMYYTTWSMGPFGVKGPYLPPEWSNQEPKQKFDLHWFRNRHKDGG